MASCDLYLKKIEIDQTLFCEKNLNVDLYDLTILFAIKKLHQHGLYSTRLEFDGEVWYGITLQQIISFIPLLPKSKVTYNRIKDLSENGLIYFHREMDFPIGFFYRLKNLNEKNSEIGTKSQKLY